MLVLWEVRLEAWSPTQIKYGMLSSLWLWKDTWKVRRLGYTVSTISRLLDAEFHVLFPYRFDFGKSLDKLLIVNKLLKQLYRKPRIGVKDPLYADVWLNLKVKHSVYLARLSQAAEKRIVKMI